mmetsp:Transcript_61430/g.116004  ORF Transcript_61430/g.116004 Transcript_61430/m.116004 type:complete len:195 (+) Transcript_61430:241-825(+)
MVVHTRQGQQGHQKGTTTTTNMWSRSLPSKKGAPRCHATISETILPSPLEAIPLEAIIPLHDHQNGSETLEHGPLHDRQSGSETEEIGTRRLHVHQGGSAAIPTGMVGTRTPGGVQEAAWSWGVFCRVGVVPIEVNVNNMALFTCLALGHHHLRMELSIPDYTTFLFRSQTFLEYQSCLLSLATEATAIPTSSH